MRAWSWRRAAAAIPSARFQRVRGDRKSEKEQKVETVEMVMQRKARLHRAERSVIHMALASMAFLDLMMGERDQRLARLLPSVSDQEIGNNHRSSWICYDDPKKGRSWLQPERRASLEPCS